jgi:ribosomal-protein-alanine N-acetyltransferase
VRNFRFSPGKAGYLKASEMTNKYTHHGLLRTHFRDIQTPRLDLIAVTQESLQCQVGFGPEMQAELGSILNAKVPPEWPHENWEPHVLDYLMNLIAENPEAIGWCRYLVLRHDNGTRTLIGTFGSGFPAHDTGEAEVGYGILPDFQRQGYAPEAVDAMLPWLETQRRIHAFTAQTFPHLRGSIRVLEKCGFKPVGKGYEEGAILFRKQCMPGAAKSE